MNVNLKELIKRYENTEIIVVGLSPYTTHVLCLRFESEVTYQRYDHPVMLCSWARHVTLTVALSAMRASKPPKRDL